MSEDFATFMKRRAEIASAYVNGDASPLDGVLADSGSATFFGPSGGAIVGADTVKSRYDRDALAFERGGDTDLEILQAGGDNEVGYWIGFQNATARLKGMSRPADMRLRVTEIFRKTNGKWTMIHRHADMLVEEKKPT
jgi:ketosteroid isomerase-like protein